MKKRGGKRSLSSAPLRISKAHLLLAPKRCFSSSQRGALFCYADEYVKFKHTDQRVVLQPMMNSTLAK